jgi:hypothetical protein
MTDDLISYIRKRHDHDQTFTDNLHFPEHHWARARVGWQAHNDRAALLAEVERLRTGDCATSRSAAKTACRPKLSAAGSRARR